VDSACEQPRQVPSSRCPNPKSPMAKIILNPAVNGFSGRSGNLVYRQVGDETIVAQRPSRPTRAATPAQLAQRERFRLAGAYATRVLADPFQRRVYETMAASLNRRADKIVAADFLTPPVVETIDLSAYRGKIGDVIRIIATDDIEVVSVNVAIQTAAGNTFEQGAASKVHGVWIYTATIDAPAGERLAITATAKDRPGHDGTKTMAWP
jgi:hypothetical protein